MKIVAVAQARMGSSRLPGKVMRDLGGKPTLEWVVSAAKRARGVSECVVATSTNAENDILEIWCADHNILCIRGSEDDVLDRYRLVVEKTKADAVVRLTADCPFLDSNVISDVVGLFKNNNCDYASNIDPPTWPDGLDCEVISARAILTAASEATRQTDRDTVTRFIARNRSRFPSKTLICPLHGLHKERWVLDSPEDYQFLQEIIAKMPPGWTPNYLDVLDLLRDTPELRKINASLPRNERFFDALAHEPPFQRSFARSLADFQAASEIIPLGAQTFSKSYLQFPKDEAPLFLSHGDGGYAFDVDGNDYVDLVGALLPNVLGYRDPDVDYAIREQLCNGISFSLSTELEYQLASRLIKHIPCAEMVKFGKNGADATAGAIRLARGATERDRVMIVNNSYHGWHDWSIGSTERNLGVPLDRQRSVERVSGDLDKIERILDRASKRERRFRFAAIILEPEGRSQAYLNRLRWLADHYEVVLIFDEVITGFRWHLGGYQKHIGVKPDLACFGKAMANGMPLSAIVGRKELMKRFAPPNNVFYSGTFFGETLSLAASIATIDKMESCDVIKHLWNAGRSLRAAVMDKIEHYEIADCINLYGEGPRIHIRIDGNKNLSADQIRAIFAKNMAAEGVLVISSHNICYAHSGPELARIVTAYDRTLARIKDAMGSHSNVIPFKAVGVR